jgi:hypothetical protein
VGERRENFELKIAEHDAAKYRLVRDAKVRVQDSRARYSEKWDVTRLSKDEYD